MKSLYKNILVYLDGSDGSVAAAQAAVCLAKTTGASLSGVFVVNTGALNDLLTAKIFIESEREEYAHDMEKDSDKYLGYLEKTAAAVAMDAELIRETGTAHVVVKKIIREREIDLLVMGELSASQSRLNETYSISERVARLAPCSVLMVCDDENIWDFYDQLKE